MTEISKDELYRLYVTEGRPMREVAGLLGVAVGSVYNYLHRFEIETKEVGKGFSGKTHSEQARARISDACKGKKVSAETREKISMAKKQGGIGHKKKRGDGYIQVYFPDHPMSTSDGYILEHILVMEALIGRHLCENECVHHKNEVKDDNRKENLQLMTKQEHMSYHGTKRWDEKRRDDLSTK